MIYLDNAATTWPKPDQVYNEVMDAMKDKCGNPGRSGHKLSIEACNILDQTRYSLSKLFNVSDMNRIVFTLNATDALNLAINGVLKKGDHVITSSMEHNSVTRPLEHLKMKGVEVEIIHMDAVNGIDPDDIKKSIKKNTKLVIVTHASNVTGTINPIAEIGGVCTNSGVPLLVDASQSTGIINIDVEKMGIHMLAFPGHKGLLGPAGTGGLYIAEGISVTPSRVGGTGIYSEMPLQPEMMPFCYESGTQNISGLAGLNAGVGFIMNKSVDQIYEHENKMVKHLVSGLEQIEKVMIYGPKKEQKRASVVSINIDGVDCTDAATVLNASFDIGVRPGLHCAPHAHRTLGTFENGGTIRISPGFFNTEEDIDSCIKAISEIASEF